jgi:hypothetical protein
MSARAGESAESGGAANRTPVDRYSGAARFGRDSPRLPWVPMRRRRRTESWDSGVIVPCHVAREAISAFADGEESPVSEAMISAHLIGCDGCRAFREGVVSLRREMRVHGVVPEQRRQAEALVSRGLVGPEPAWRVSRAPRWVAFRQVSWLRASQWAAGALPLGVAVPALVLGVFHVHIVPSHISTPCTVSLVHHARR